MDQVRIRSAARNDLSVLREIEWASGQRFREFGLDHVADGVPASVEVLADFADGGRAWVAVDDADRPIGFIVVEVIDGGGHIEQVSVVPDHQGRGVGRALIERAKDWGITSGLAALTLTTFGHVPWNRPLYEHLGFRVLAEKEISSGVQARRQAEADHGLDPDLRVVMRLEL